MIKIDPEFKALIPPLAPDELRQLEENILRDGCRDPLVVWTVPPDESKFEPEELSGRLLTEEEIEQSVGDVCMGWQAEFIARSGKFAFVRYRNPSDEYMQDWTSSWVIGIEGQDSGFLDASDEILIDGHNRFEICTRHGLPFETKEMVFGDRSHAIEWIIRNQFGRRNLPPYIRTKLALVLEETIAKRAGQRMIAGKKTDPSQKSEQGKTAQQLAAIAGVSHDTVAKVKKIEAKATPQVKAKLASGEMSINEAHKDIVKEEKREEKHQKLRDAVEEIASTPDFLSVCDIRACSMADLFQGIDHLDAVVTDPPYPEEFLPLYEELARHCAKIGVKVVAAMAGQSYLPQIYAAMSKHLKYRWTLAYMTPGGQAVQQWQAKVNTFWKPILLFGESEEWLGDVATSKANDNDKRYHGWGQSESGMMDLVDRLTKPGDLICDPFAGAGTTAVAALAMGRRFIGCDIDPFHAETAKARALLAFKKLKS